jgi:2-polyprenyl-3-methyl-5-hydroxy-6-metoxy-1,4-benzoquinol methylase
MNFGGIVGKQVLEVACGGGNVADRFAEECAIVYGFDYNLSLTS